MRLEPLLAIELDTMRHTHIADGPPGRVGRIACIMDCGVPTHSSTTSAPIPFVISLMRSTPSSPRSVTTSVAPNSCASFCRVACPLMAMIRPAPICFAERTPSRPTAPSPTTATVMPGFTLAASAANQPVPSKGLGRLPLSRRRPLGHGFLRPFLAFDRYQHLLLAGRALPS
jgi:hypothetical protein